MEAEKEKFKNEQHHQESTIAYLELERRASQLEKQLRKSVNKAKYIIFLFDFFINSCYCSVAV